MPRECAQRGGRGHRVNKRNRCRTRVREIVADEAVRQFADERARVNIDRHVVDNRTELLGIERFHGIKDQSLAALRCRNKLNGANRFLHTKLRRNPPARDGQLLIPCCPVSQRRPQLVQTFGILAALGVVSIVRTVQKSVKRFASKSTDAAARCTPAEADAAPAESAP